MQAKNQSTMDHQIGNIPSPKYKRIVIIGGGFAGLKLARKLSNSKYQVVLIDKNNFHQFQPLFYQVATAGLEPSAISFPFRRLFHKKKNVHFRMAKLEEVDVEDRLIRTNIGHLIYDYLLICTGADTNFFGLENVRQNSLAMKNTGEALTIRNTILSNFEKALNTDDEQEQQSFLNIVIVGGGPTGVELAGAIAEMKRYVLPKDYPELDFDLMKIYLFEASPRVLSSMSVYASEKSTAYLEQLGVIVNTSTAVKDYDGKAVFLDHETIPSRTLLWAAGVSSRRIHGMPESVYVRGNRMRVDRFNKVMGLESVFALGDIAYMKTEDYPEGHPQVAQVALQQADNFVRNLKNFEQSAPPIEFDYKDLGSMATIGRNLAVADLPIVKLKGFIAWAIWLFVHLMSILGVKNKLIILINWAWNYFTYDQTLRLLLQPTPKRKYRKRKEDVLS
jgi:NADH dehydrogenase